MLGTVRWSFTNGTTVLDGCTTTDGFHPDICNNTGNVGGIVLLLRFNDRECCDGGGCFKCVSQDPDKNNKAEPSTDGRFWSPPRWDGRGADTDRCCDMTALVPVPRTTGGGIVDDTVVCGGSFVVVVVV
jgi:hypothetical protein